MAGAVGPPLFVVVFLIEGATRPGYSPWRHFVSQLATGEGGWVQTLNFILCGLLVLAFSAGLGRSLGRGRASVAAPVLLAGFGIALVVAGVFPTDPALGYPPGAPAAHTTHGLIHGLAGLATFTLLPAAAFAMAWRFTSDTSSRAWAVYSVLTGLLLLAGFVASNVVAVLDARGALPNAPTGLVQRISIIAGWSWVALLAARQLRAG